MLFEIKNMSVRYGATIQALWDVSLSLNEGEIVSVIGANGAGKTTLLRSVMGLVKAESGEVFYNGKKVTGTADKRVGSGIIMVPEGRQIFTNLTVGENLKMGAYLTSKHSNHKRTMENVMSLFPRLAERENQMAGTLSGGEQQMVAIGRAMLGEPKVLLLDEPSLGLAPLLVKEVFSTIRKINEGGTSIILVEQNAREALKLSDRGYVLERGNIVNEGKSATLLNDERIVDAYLGA